MSALLDRANALAVAGSLESVDLYRQVLASDPGCADAANNLGVMLRHTGADREAEQCYRHALAHAPDHPDACYNLGRVVLDLGDAAAAIRPLQHAVAARPQAERWHTLGQAWQALHALAAAAECYRAALHLSPDSLESGNNLANVLQAQGNGAAAIALLDATLAHHPGNAELRYNRALAKLLCGRMAEGWADYEARWKARGFPSPARDFGLPCWTGESAPHATLLLHWEQGLGDTIQFARYVALARARVGGVVLLVQPPLRHLLADIAGADCVAADGETLPQADLQAPLLGLPHRLGCPPVPPPCLTAAAPRRSAGGLRVGLVWAGNARHSNDRNRSLPSGALDRLLRLPGIAWHSLQAGPRAGDYPDLPVLPDGDFAATADAVRALDLVIAVDTAVAHLAGSLGVPVWLLLPAAPDWRWGQSGGFSGWYPSMRLFRQPAAGRWDSVLAAIEASLRGLTGR